MALFTKGPWSRFREPEAYLINAPTRSIARLQHADPEALANAHLITAAPELFEALADLCAWQENNPTGMEMLAAINHAHRILDKARGKKTP